MECRLGCGACCIAPSITTAIPGMPEGKPAGVRCIQLNEDNLCKIFGQTERPDVCLRFAATEDVCGATNDEAIWLIQSLEAATQS
ncbi:YkgJ family cysteine cluster protein [Shewanella sp. Scap07]|uniref:YkgJ family cysteine cluster protein n=1 Tax=Shewanella sp. Scap07 TaxID=2589987 RepID=UPI0015C15387|nr:YkgJ family cysteine cluster protein [Shewanella sp. Scap07]QLE83647.1 YkgJ family cysteine cluster protein [Shewanella sp. Scap07]